MCSLLNLSLLSLHSPFSFSFSSITTVGFYSEEKINLTEALKGYTLDPAYAAFQEDNLGSLEVVHKYIFWGIPIWF